VYASIRQAKAKTGMAEELARRIKEGAIPIISDVEGFMAYPVTRLALIELLYHPNLGWQPPEIPRAPGG
jgi:hypothetical protein